MWDASGTVHVSSCHLQDDTANQILRCLTTAAQRPSSTEGMPSLSIRVGITTRAFADIGVIFAP